MTRNQKVQATIPRIKQIRQRLADQMPDLRLMGSNDKEYAIRDELMAAMWVGVMQEKNDKAQADKVVELSLIFQSVMLSTGTIDESGNILKRHHKVS